MGPSHEKHFQNCHRVLNRAQWSSRQAARTLLGLLAKAFVPRGPLVLGIDEMLERRRGDKIAAKVSIMTAPAPATVSLSRAAKSDGYSGYADWINFRLAPAARFAAGPASIPISEAALHYPGLKGGRVIGLAQLGTPVHFIDR